MKISVENNGLKVPNIVDIPYIEGDGIGPDISKATKRVVDEALGISYGGDRKINWMELMAGEKAISKFNTPLPDETVKKMTEYRISLKGPLTTPVGGGFRSINVTLRQIMDLYANVRPVKYYPGLPSPLKSPEKVDMVVFRENTEDVYMGIEFPANSKEAEQVIELMSKLGYNIRKGSGIGIKPISKFGTSRISKMAIEYAFANGRKSVTIMHKGNIMKYTEGAFKEWAYETARTYGDKVVNETEVSGKNMDGKIVIKDRIADNMFQQILLRPDEYDIILCPNLNGDYISDALAAQIGGIGVAPSGNIGDNYAVFEAVHGSAPKYANLDVADPSSLLLSAVMMLRYIRWNEPANLIEKAFVNTLRDKQVPQDLARHLGVKSLKTSEFAESIVQHMSKN
ncbi:MAG: NADP-dependent isocitrate dehydrogenase [Thermoplasmatales archaeon]|nr:NADP-dependent isocitrate dehydrogenase [Candidatus Thermoplasmatota archaeon]MCL6002813.1 NADP-dependent isocitrate dehydrogenase [Candidatus Thermoplasmatota archaeon]MDA8056059.1 NADP-dependent isocitrate dehydrogenase [Thermoplasmatales archaeon]